MPRTPTPTPALSRGRVDDIQFTSGGAGNQWTYIDGQRYATWWDVRTKDWKRGDSVTFRPYMRALWHGMEPIPCADSIRKESRT